MTDTIIRQVGQPPALTGELTPAIVVSHLTKQFRIRYRTSLKQRFLVQGNKLPGIRTFLALNDVSFTVPHGQTVGVVGRNGSGKSTLMGLLARVYKKTSGSIGLYSSRGGPARIAPLLELAAGFHLDLTGEENILFYGAVLGMDARWMEEKFDEIIAFAELGDKVRTTLRNWNDGARLRLGFSIAVHIDPDILLIDEVLAVGDEGFQAKCFNLINSMRDMGKATLCVSHELYKIEKVADRIIWMDGGKIRMDGDADEVLAAYREFSARPNPPET